MKIIIASLIQESNTFCPIFTDLDTYRNGYYYEGDEIKKRLLNTNTEVAGFYSLEETRTNITIVPTFAAWAVTSGKLKEATFKYFFDKLMGMIKNNLPCDGILLALHGALVSEDNDDTEGVILDSIRNMVNDIPVVCTHDYHACITERMVKNADILVGYKTYPHIDFYETGKKAGEILLKLIEDKPAIKKIFYQLPLILPVENTQTENGPMEKNILFLKEQEKKPDILVNSICCTQPWLDVPENCMSVTAYYISKEEKPEIEDKYKALLMKVWNNKSEYYINLPDADKTLENVYKMKKPVIIVDCGDITSAGGIGDSTVILRELLKGRFKYNTVLMVVDEKTVEKALSIGEGGQGTFEIGGKANYGYNAPISVNAKVRCIKQGSVVVKGSALKGLELNMGVRVLLTHENIRIIAAQRTQYAHDPELYSSMGIKLEDMDLIVVKAHKLFIPAYRHISNNYIYVNTPGFTSANLTELEFKKVCRPIYPLDDEIFIGNDEKIF